MKNQHPIAACFADDRGFTLIELSITMLLAILLSGIMLSAYLFVSRAFSSRQRHIRVENTFQTLIYRLSSDLFDADQLFVVNDSTWLLAYSTGDTVRYAYASGKLLRASRPMAPSDVRVTGFHIVPSYYDAAFARLPGDVAVDDEKKRILVSIDLAIHGYDIFRSGSTCVEMRKARPWRSINTF